MSTAKNANATKTASKKTDAPVTNTKKAEKTLTTVNLEKAASKAEAKKAERVPKYLYPADCKTQADKKAFRRQSRTALRSFEKQMMKLEKSNEATAKKELDALKKEHGQFVKATYTAK